MLDRLKPITTVLCAVAVGVTLLKMREDAGTTWETANWLGMFSSEQIWDGAWWAYLTTVFPHGDFLHLALNLYWMWMLGTGLEERLGLARYGGLVVVTAFVASGLQFAATGATGIGLSGVGYGLFGYAWIRSRFDPALMLDPQIVRLFVIWFFVAILIDQAGLMGIANWAHGGGLASGAAIAALAHGNDRRWRAIGAVGFVALIGLSVAPLVAQPWNTDWLRHEALRLQVADENEAAVEYYDRVIERDPADAWDHNRGVALRDLGRFERASKDFERAAQLDPEYDF
jgi:rhomboid protease GluP